MIAFYPAGYHLWRDRLLDGVDQGLYPAKWLDRRVEEGSAKLFTSDGAAMLAEISTFPSGAREVHCLVAAGDIPAIVELAPSVEAWGADCGATRASVSSHPAWARLLRGNGYSPSQLTIVKDLRDGA